MKYSEFREKLRYQLGALPPNRIIDFALDICDSLYPEYLNFHSKYKWGNPSSLRNAIDFCRTNKSLVNIDPTALDRLKRDLEKCTPDMDDFGDSYGSFGLNACCAVLGLLGYFKDHDLQHILDISSYATDTIDFKIQDEEENLTDEQLEFHPRMQAEQQRQLEMINIA